MIIRAAICLAAVVVLLMQAACGSITASQPTLSPSAIPTATSEPEYWPQAEWRVSTPEEQGLDSQLLEQMIEMIEGQDYHYDSVVVIRNGYLVFERYFHGYDEKRLHHMQSTTKSVSSILIGTLLQNGFLQDVDQKMVDLFSDYEIANLDSRKEAITLEHLLTMSEGMDWHELDYPYTDPNNSLGQMWVSTDAIQHVLDTPMRQEPGLSNSYNSGTSILLGGVIEETTDMDVQEYAQEQLFTPLGITDFRWDKTTGEHYHTDGGLYLTPRDMARIGYLMLHDGNWQGRQIVSLEWVKQSTRSHYALENGGGYGYQWWILPAGVFAATGHYEQMIYVVPETDMVVVFTGYIPDDVLAPTSGLLYRYILDSIQEPPGPIPEQVYESNGVHLEYPAGLSLSEQSIRGENVISERSGSLQLMLTSYPLELYQVLWAKPEGEIDLSDVLEDVFTGIPEGFGISVTTEPIQAGTWKDYETQYRYFDYSQGELDLRGMAVAWFCDESERGFITLSMTNPDFSDLEIETGLLAFMEGLDCH